MTFTLVVGGKRNVDRGDAGSGYGMMVVTVVVIMNSLELEDEVLLYFYS